MRTFVALLAFASLLLVQAPTGSAQAGAQAPEDSWMVHIDHGSGTWRFLPERIVLVPGGTVQLMVFGEGNYSLLLDDGTGVDITAPGGPMRVAEFAAPLTPGEYAFHDRHHPEARGVLVVAPRSASTSASAASATTEPPIIGVVPGGYEATFSPARIEVDPGASVIFRANGTFGHDLHAVDGSFDAGELNSGEETRFTAPMTPGEYAFECKFHKDLGMKGVLVVRAGAASPTTASPTPASPTPTAAPSPEEAVEPAPVPGIGVLGVLMAAAGVAFLVARRRA